MDKLPEDIDGEGGEDFRNWGQKRSKRPFLTKVRREIADIAIWDKDMYTIPSEDLQNLKCVMTVYNGQVVFALN